MALDLSKDAAVIDDPVMMMYVVKTGEGAFADREYISGCQVSALTKADLTANPKLLEKDAAVVHLWRCHLKGIVPKIGDKMQQDQVDCGTDTTVVWVVQSVGMLDRDRQGYQRYRAIVIRSTGAQTL